MGEPTLTPEERLHRMVDYGALYSKTNAIVQLSDLAEVLSALTAAERRAEAAEAALGRLTHITAVEARADADLALIAIVRLDALEEAAKIADGMAQVSRTRKDDLPAGYALVASRIRALASSVAPTPPETET